MLLKRKRSANFLSSPTSDSSSTNSVQAFYPPTKPILSPLQQDWKTIIPYDADTPSHLNARTRKRHRDNRPDASTVHGASNISSSSSSGTSCWLGAVIQMSALADVCRVAASTIQRLYDAQRANANANVNENANLLPSTCPQHQEPEAQSQPQAVQQTVPQKSTLHSFWNIAQPAPSQAQLLQEPSAVTGTEGPPRCEDCDGDLRADEDAMEVDIGEGSIEDKACASCRRRICDTCAVVAHERVCESCAKGGHGW